MSVDRIDPHVRLKGLCNAISVGVVTSCNPLGEFKDTEVSFNSPEEVGQLTCWNVQRPSYNKLAKLTLRKKSSLAKPSFVKPSSNPPPLGFTSHAKSIERGGPPPKNSRTTEAPTPKSTKRKFQNRDKCFVAHKRGGRRRKLRFASYDNGSRRRFKRYKRTRRGETPRDVKSKGKLDYFLILAALKTFKRPPSNFQPKTGIVSLPDGPGTAQGGSATAQKGSATAQKGSATAQKGSATAQKGSATAQEGSATAQEGLIPTAAPIMGEVTRSLPAQSDASIQSTTAEQDPLAKASSASMESEEPCNFFKQKEQRSLLGGNTAVTFAGNAMSTSSTVSTVCPPLGNNAQHRRRHARRVLYRNLRKAANDLRQGHQTYNRNCIRASAVRTCDDEGQCGPWQSRFDWDTCQAPINCEIRSSFFHEDVTTPCDIVLIKQRVKEKRFSSMKRAFFDAGASNHRIYFKYGQSSGYPSGVIWQKAHDAAHAIELILPELKPKVILTPGKIPNSWNAMVEINALPDHLIAFPAKWAKSDLDPIAAVLEAVPKNIDALRKVALEIAKDEMEHGFLRDGAMRREMLLNLKTGKFVLLPLGPIDPIETLEASNFTLAPLTFQTGKPEYSREQVQSLSEILGKTEKILHKLRKEAEQACIEGFGWVPSPKELRNEATKIRRTAGKALGKTTGWTQSVRRFLPF